MTRLITYEQHKCIHVYKSPITHAFNLKLKKVFTLQLCPDEWDNDNLEPGWVEIKSNVKINQATSYFTSLEQSPTWK